MLFVPIRKINGLEDDQSYLKIKKGRRMNMCTYFTKASAAWRYCCSGLTLAANAATSWDVKLGSIWDCIFVYIVDR